MELGLDPSLAGTYRSPSQVARVLSEHWAGRELYCPACPADRLDPYPAGTKVRDFHCVRCGAQYQLKAKRGGFGASVTNSAYAAKMEAIRRGRVPNYVFLGYDPSAWRVTSGFVVPGHFVTQSVIDRRSPLGPSARRAGWVGSIIRLGRLPPDARITLIERFEPRPAAHVRAEWERFRFLNQTEPRSRGWISDVLAVIRALGQAQFHLSDLYARADDLRRLHPNNRHVVPKIRQQVHVLRDEGILGSLGQGRYRVIA